MQNSQTCARLLALRDFFIAKNVAQLSEAYSDLSKIEASAPQDIDWVETEYAFNKLFVGPDAPIAPLYASCYLEEESRLMGQSTLHMRELMQAMGLSLELNIPDDHIALELEVWVRIEYILEQENTKEVVKAVEQARYWLICEHLVVWIPKFVQCTLKSDNLAINYVTSCLERCVNNARLGLE